MKASQIAALVDGVIEGGDDPEISAVAPLDRAGPGDLSLLAHPRYLTYLPQSRAGAVLVAKSLAAQAITTIPHIRVDDVHAALATLLPHLYPEPNPEPGIHPTAVVAAGAEIAGGVRIGEYVVVGRGTRIGAGARLYAHVVVGEDCAIGEEAVLHPHVALYAGSRVGARSVLHSGVRVGVDGFGYTPGPRGLRKVPQVGGCVIGEDVEIGANCTIDRGSVGNTEIGDGVKMDNLVHVGHNVRIGAHSIVVAQVGVAGSTKIGGGVTIGGQAGINGHIEIGNGATIGAQAGVFGDVPAGATYSGYPARPHKEAMRAQAALFRMPDLMKRFRALERALLGRAAADD